MTFNISVFVMPIFFLPSFRDISDDILHENIVYLLQFWYCLCNCILQTFGNVPSAKKKNVRKSFFGKDPAPVNLWLFFSSKIPVGNLIIREIPPFWTRPISLAFSYRPCQETKRCNSFLWMRREIRFLSIFTENTYLIMNSEFINSQEHK